MPGPGNAAEQAANDAVLPYGGPDRDPRHGPGLRGENLAPKAVEWDQTKYFPVDVMREAAALGMGGRLHPRRRRRIRLTRLDAALIFEALATGCPTVSAYLSIHNMAAWMIDRYGSDEQRHRSSRSCAPWSISRAIA